MGQPVPILPPQRHPGSAGEDWVAGAQGVPCPVPPGGGGGCPSGYTPWVAVVTVMNPALWPGKESAGVMYSLKKSTYCSSLPLHSRADEEKKPAEQGCSPYISFRGRLLWLNQETGTWD